MAADEPVHHVGEPSELPQQRDSRVHVPHHDVVLGIGERPGLLQDRVRHRQLADVVEEAADGEVAESLGRQPELVADLCRAECDPARVLLRVRVLLGELDEERADVRPEKRLGLGDEVGAAEVSEQRPRARDSAAQIVRDGEAHGRDPDDLEDVAEPPAEVPVVEEKSCRESATASHAMPTATRRSAPRCVSRYVRSARQKSTA